MDNGDEIGPLEALGFNEDFFNPPDPPMILENILPELLGLPPVFAGEGGEIGDAIGQQQIQLIAGEEGVDAPLNIAGFDDEEEEEVIENDEPPIVAPAPVPQDLEGELFNIFDDDEEHAIEFAEALQFADGLIVVEEGELGNILNPEEVEVAAHPPQEAAPANDPLFGEVEFQPEDNEDAIQFAIAPNIVEEGNLGNVLNPGEVQVAAAHPLPAAGPANDPQFGELEFQPQNGEDNNPFEDLQPLIDNFWLN